MTGQFQSHLNRRDFLRLSVLTLFSTLLWGCDNDMPATPRDETILIVGAGVAGLAAARELQKQGFTVIVLEGRRRMGGRIFTDRSLSIPVDLGASWIHGTHGNPIADLRDEFDLETLETDYESVWMYDSSGAEIPDWEITQAESQMEELTALLYDYAEELDHDVTIQAAIDHLLAGKEIGERERQILNRVIADLEMDIGADLAGLSLWYSTEDEEFGGGDELFPGGYDQVIEKLAEGLDVRLNQIVRRITYDDTGVQVETDSETFTADRAVITLPLGVLKTGLNGSPPLPLQCGECHTLDERASIAPEIIGVTFSPALPATKQAAIQNLKMGLLNKVALEFGEIFWPKQPHFIGYVAQDKGVFPFFLNMNRYADAAVLVAFTGADFAWSLEKLKDEEIVAQAMAVLRTIHGADIPDPTAYKISRWGSDHFAGGAYTHVPFGTSDADYDTLAEPVGDRLFFAGEATHRTYPGTVHGAFLSGVREARRIGQL